jgi:DnaJ-like protein/PilZ domain-containing protein
MEQEGVVAHIEDRSLTPDEIGMLAGLITEESDHYTVLGVDRNASPEEIQKAYCLAVEYFHPLKSRKITESDSVMHWKLSSAFLRIEEAFTVLSRRSRRSVYDDKLTSQPRHAGANVAGHLRTPLQPPVASPSAPDATKIRGKELRRVERVPLNLPLKVTFDRYWQEMAETLDVSPLGVRFRLTRSLEPGSELRLELPMPKYLRTHSYEDDMYVVNAFVIYASNSDSGRRVVAEFI